MTPKEEMLAVLSGRAVTPPPQLLFHDLGYIMRRQGKCPRDYWTGSGAERRAYLENGFALHPCEGYFVHGNSEARWAESHVIEDRADDFWVVRDLTDGSRVKMDRDANRFTMDGRPIHMLDSNFESLIRTREDIRRLVPNSEDILLYDPDGYCGALRSLARRYPDIHFAGQVASPYVRAIEDCGGYEAGMCLLLDDPALMRELMEAEIARRRARLPAIAAAGAGSVYFTTYYSGAETISPQLFRELVLPAEAEMMQLCRDAGLLVIYWFLGDMRPLLDDIAGMPFDALAPEQPRRGYRLDYALLRDKLGAKRCLFSHTVEAQMIACDRAAIARTWREQYAAAGSGPFAAGNTITPADADPAALEWYRRQVRGEAL